MLVRWGKAMLRIISWVGEKPTARDVRHGVTGPVLDAPLTEQPALIATPILPFSSVEEVPVYAMR